MQSFSKKSIIALVIAMLLVSVVVVPSYTSAKEQPNSSAGKTWQTDAGVQKAYNSQTGALNYVSFDPSVRGNYNFQAQNAADAKSDLSSFALEFGMSDISKNMRAVRTDIAPSSKSTSYLFQQVHNGVPVIGGEIRMIYDRNGQLAAISGEASAKLQLNTTPLIEANVAAQNALEVVAKELGMDVAALQVSAPELWIYDATLTTPFPRPVELVWRMEITGANTPGIRYLFLYNAHLGGSILMLNLIDTYWGEAAQSAPIVNNAPEQPLAANFWIPNHNGHYITYDSNNTSSRGGTGSSTLECDTTQPASVTLFAAGSCDGTGSPASAANAAQYFSQETFDYFDFYFGRNSINGSGMTLISNVNYTPGGLYANAFWDGTQMTYGNDGFWPADDVVTHEMSHAVTQFTSNLIYYSESGAINEAYSDIFGEYQDMLNGVHSRLGSGNPDGILDPGDAGNWTMGEDLTIGAIRSMSNPPAFGDPDRTRSANWLAPSSSSFYSCSNDCSGVHQNSGVANKAAWLMAVGATFNGQTITPLGATLEDSIELAGQIWYDTEYILTSGSDYGVLDLALVTACNALVGVTTPGTAETLSAADCTEVDQVTTATEMNLEPVSAGWSPEAAVACTDGTDIISNLYFNDFESGTMAGMTAANISGNANDWQVQNYIPHGPEGSYAWSGDYSLWSGDNANAATHNSVRLSSAVALTGGNEYFLYFHHAFDFEGSGTTFYDGGQVDYSLDNGANWTNLLSLFVDGRNYHTSNINAANTSMGGQRAFTGDSHGYNSTRYNLTSLAGQNVMIRWRIASDGSVQDLNWLLDDVRIYRCADTGGPTATPVTPTNTPVTPTNTPVTPTSTPVTPTSTPVTPTSTPTTCVISVTPPTLSSPLHRAHTTDTTPSFSWSQVSGAQSYRLMVYTEDRSFEFKKRRVGETSTSYTLAAAEALTAGTKYLWRVRTQDLGCGTWTNWSTRNTLFVD